MKNIVAKVGYSKNCATGDHSLDSVHTLPTFVHKSSYRNKERIVQTTTYHAMYTNRIGGWYLPVANLSKKIARTRSTATTAETIAPCGSNHESKETKTITTLIGDHVPEWVTVTAYSKRFYS